MEFPQHRISSPNPRTSLRNGGRSSYSTNSHTRQSSSHFHDSPYTKYFLQQSPMVDNKKIPEESEMEFILKKSERSVNEAILLYKQLKSFHFFKKFQYENSHLRIIEALIHLSKIVQYEFHPAGTMIYKKGASSNHKIYLIYSGEVASWNSKATESSLQHIEQEKKPEEKTEKLNLNFGLIKLTNIQNVPPTKQLRRVSHFSFAHVHAKSRLTNSENDVNRHNSHGTLESLSHIQQEKSPKVLFKNSIDLSKITRFSSKPTISTSRSPQQQPSQRSEDGSSSQRVLKRTFIKGRHFGDKTIKSKGGPREETVMTLTDCVLLSFTEEDYKYLMARFNSKNFGLLNFLLDCIPGFEKVFKYLRIKSFESYFKEEIFSLHAPITSEAKNGNKIYLLYKGFCEITKMVQTPMPRLGNVLSSPQGKKFQNSFQKVTICQIRPGVFIGEEILFNESGEYDQTVQALSSSTKVLSIEKDIFLQIMPEEILDELKKLYLSKTQHNEKLLLQKTQNSKNKSCSNFSEKQRRRPTIISRKDSISPQNYIEIRSTESSCGDSYQDFLQFEDRIHQYWRAGMLKNSKLIDNSGIRSNNNKTAFRNKPYFRKKLEEKFSEKNTLKSCFSPIKEVARIQKRSKTSSSCDAQPRQSPIDNVNAYHKRVLTAISPKNADLILNPPIRIFGNKTFTNEMNKIYFDEIDEGKRKGPKPVRVIKTESSPNKITAVRLENSFDHTGSKFQFARFNLLCFGASQVPKIKKNQKEVYGFHNRKNIKSKTPTHL